MATWLRQSTATTIVVGPLVDSVTADQKTGLTISQSEVLLWKQGGTGFSAKNESTAATHRSYGMYTVPLDTTDTNTLGQLVVGVYESGILVARENYQVVAANVWDSMFGADKLQVDAVEVNSSAAAAARLALSAGVIIPGTSDNTGFTATTTIFESDDVTEATSDHYKGCVIKFTSGALLGQATAVTAYSLSSGRGRFTVNALTEAVPDDSTFVIV